MADRFKDLNVNTSQKKSNNKNHNNNNNNNARENIFKSSQNQNSQRREITGKTLEQLAQETNNRSSSGKYQHKYRERGNNDRKKMFPKSKIREYVKPKEEFKIETAEFPELVKCVHKDEIIENVYKDKVNKVQEESFESKPTLRKGWVNLSVIKQMTKPDKNTSMENEISPYYNPILAKKILEDRLKYREELNDLLGDISPYWNMVYPDDLDDSDNNDSDEETEEEEEYVEDW